MARILQALIDALADLFMMTPAPPPRANLAPLERKPPLIVPPVTEVEPMGARRCSLCALDLPNTSEFATCPQCDGDTSPFANASAMPLSEARALKKLDPRYVFKDLTYEQRKEMMQDWAEMEAERERRGKGRWSLADVFEDYRRGDA